MFGQIVDLLVKQDDERRRIVFLFLKLMFTLTIGVKLFSSTYGVYDIVSIINFKSLVDFFIQGSPIICFALFYFVWSISFGLFPAILSFTGIWLANILYKIFNKTINDSEQFISEISKNKLLQKLVKISIGLFNTVDIIEIENNTVKPGTQFYKFYDYLLDIEDGKKTVNVREFSDTLSLILQFIVIYYLLDFKTLSLPWLLYLSAVIILCVLVVTSFFTYALATLVDIKHSRLLDLMEKLEPNYKKPTNE